MKMMSRIFNHLMSRQDGASPSSKTMCYPPSPTTFFRDELESALREQSFGLQSFRVTSSTPRQSSASLVTLEGLSLTIVLNTQGYSVDAKRSDAFQSLKPGQLHVYETIENLLQTISPMYTQRHQGQLFEALQRLA
ncbi:GSKIP domain-containing protein [Ephemerocybe angulata]|uniref:GSKIP domain-containing protein n=1 Tax=Ephemerocybe angulata TaxID=980116 RepID=A0A8H6I4U0_9AGAR|nr:GSKIP domain-containing protein [Tulosesus angulatus]